MQFHFADWLVFIAYGLVMIFTAWYFGRVKVGSSSDYFLAGNSMPAWLVAISVLATSQSAATFLGGPDQGYRGDLTYLSTTIGALIAALIVAVLLIPKFYQYKVTTVYELLEQRFGSSAKRQAGAMYLFGRLFASGARLYMAAIAVSMILFGDIASQHVALATLCLVAVGLLYSITGGIRTVIYSDVLQCVVYISAAVLVIVFLLKAIPADFSTIITALNNPTDLHHSKLTLFDWRLDFGQSGVFTMWSILTGYVLLSVASFGLDQDMTQRVLTCKSAKEGSKAMLMSVVMVLPVMLLFIVIGLLLYIVYQRPDLMMSGNSNAIEQSFSGEKITIFMYYVLNEIPHGVRGLVTVGVIAAAISTLNSGLNSMASVLVEDMYRPWRKKQLANLNGSDAPSHYVAAGRVAMLLVAMGLGAMAMLCFYWQQFSDMPLLAFALSVMIFSYSGLLGVYITALFSQRGSTASVTLALISGFIATLVLQPYVQQTFLPSHWQLDLGFTWQLCLGTLISTLVCLTGNRQQSSVTEQSREHAL